MKRAMPWNSKVGLSDDDDESSSDDSSSDTTDSEAHDAKGPGSSGTTKKAGSKEVKAGKQKSAKVLDFEALSRHGYSGGLSVLKVPPPRVDDKDRDWSWSNGKDSDVGKETEESYEERLRTKAALVEGEKLLNVQTRKEREEQREKELEKEREKKNASFSQKEKRKRDLGQASRGKNYVEEEKRLLRESGIYSGFDS